MKMQIKCRQVDHTTTITTTTTEDEEEEENEGGEVEREEKCAYQGRQSKRRI